MAVSRPPQPCGLGGCLNTFVPVSNKRFCSAECRNKNKTPARYKRRGHGPRHCYCDDPYSHTRKACSKCGHTKNREEFGLASNRHDLMQAVCKECSKEYRRTTQRASDLKRKFGITLGRFNQMLDEQGGLCAVCGEPPITFENLSVDHDHSCCPGATSCGKCVRGLLCTRCNTGIGMFKDNPARLRAAGDYVERYMNNYLGVAA